MTTRRQELLSALPASFPELAARLGLSPGNLSRVLADAMVERAVHRTGQRRKYVYRAGPPPARTVSSVFDLGARA